MVNQFTRWLEASLKYFPFSNQLCSVYYNNIINKELAMVPINAHDRILFIGGGALPYSALYLYKKTHATIDVIDHDKTLIQQAQGYFSKYNILVTVYHAYGETVNVRGYDYIIVAKQVRPKCKVIHHLIANKDPHTSVIVRTTSKDRLPKADFIQPLRYTFVKELWLYK